MGQILYPSSPGPTRGVCIIDDEAAICELLRIVCESMGLQVRTFDSADSFLAFCQPLQSGCAVLLLDLDLPGMSGLGLIRYLKSVGFDRPIIVLTAHSVPGLNKMLARLGTAAFIQKPFQIADVREQIAAALRS